MSRLIRPATQADLAALACVHGRCFPHDPWDVDRLSTPGGQIWCDADHRGFVLIRTVADEGEVISVAVDPTHQGQGLGRQLLSLAIADLVSAGVITLFLDVAVDNPPALALYRRLGFIEVGRRRGYYPRAGMVVDALAFQLQIC